jgi:hypothetical protein
MEISPWKADALRVLKREWDACLPQHPVPGDGFLLSLLSAGSTTTAAIAIQRTGSRAAAARRNFTPFELPTMLRYLIAQAHQASELLNRTEAP